MANIWLSFNGTALTRNGYGLAINSTVNPYNPLNLPAYTVRFYFGNPSYDPTQESGWATGSTWTRVYSSPNVWDYHTGTGTYSAYYFTFDSKFQDYANNPVSVLGANLPSKPTTVSDDGRAFFRNCTALETVDILDLSGFRSCLGMFAGCTNLNHIGDLNITNAQSVQAMFSGCHALSSAPGLLMPNITDFTALFKNCTTMAVAPMYSTSNISNFSGVFSGCSSLDSAPPWDTSNGTAFNDMFSDCSALTGVPLYDTSKATNVSHMLANCSSLQSVPLFDTHLVLNMQSMLNGCTSLTSIPLFNTDNVTNMSHMCYNCFNVANGALALYTQASTQSVPPTNHANCFTRCGRDTVTGSADLTQIPISWGGTMA